MNDPVNLVRSIDEVVSEAESEYTLFGMYSQETITKSVKLAKEVRDILTKNDVVADARRYHTIRELCGFVEDGSSRAISFSQDETTKTWSMTAEGHHSTIRGTSFSDVIRKAASIILVDD